MKAEQYKSVIALTSDEVNACSCECIAGAQGVEKVVCVHNLPVLLLFIIFLFDCLAQNMLVELCHRWDHNLEVKLKERLSGQKFKK